METNNIENIEEIEEVEIDEDDRGGGSATSTGCMAQVSPAPQNVMVSPLNGCCSIITPAGDYVVKTKKVNASIIKGKVRCNTNTGSSVEGAIVVATTGAGPSIKRYVGITNNLGEYSIAVPNSGPGTTTYSIAAYLVGICGGDNPCVTGTCESKCK